MIQYDILYALLELCENMVNMFAQSTKEGSG